MPLKEHRDERRRENRQEKKREQARKEEEEEEKGDQKSKNETADISVPICCRLIWHVTVIRLQFYFCDPEIGKRAVLFRTFLHARNWKRNDFWRNGIVVLAGFLLESGSNP